MTYVIIALVLLMIIAPIFAILPSKRQKAQMVLRRKAMENGFSVELTRIDDPDPDPQQYLSNTGKPLERVMAAIAYRKLRRRPPDWRRVPAEAWCVVRRRKAQGQGLPSGWDWEVKPAEPNPQLFLVLGRELPDLPNDVVKVEDIDYVTSVYWNENGGDEALSSIMEFSKAISNIAPLLPPSESD